MEYKEAIEILKNNYPKTIKVIEGQYMEYYDTKCELGQAINKAILALGKQILKEPISIGDGHKGHGTCPCCGCLIDEAYNRYVCHTCGQAVDWSRIHE